MSFTSDLAGANQRLQGENQELRKKVTELSFMLEDAREAASVDRDDYRACRAHEAQLQAEIGPLRNSLKLKSTIIHSIQDMCVTGADNPTVTLRRVLETARMREL